MHGNCRLVTLVTIAFVAFVFVGPSEQTAKADVPPYAWIVSRADTNNDTGLSTSLVLDPNDEPYISYLDQTNGIIRVAHRVAGVWSSEPIAFVGSEEGDTGIAIGRNGAVYVSFVRGDPPTVEMATRMSSNWSVARVDAGYSEGYASLTLDSMGNPVIAYTGSNGWLRYAAWNGSSWRLETVDAMSVISRYTDVAIDPAGGPHISYYADGVLRYASKGVGIWNIETVDSSPYSGWYSRLDFDQTGDPHIAYYDSVNLSLKHAERVAGTWSTETIDNRGDAGWDPSLVIDRLNRVHIAYYARLSGELRYAIRTPAGWIRETIDRDGVVGWRTAIAVNGQGLPRISYYDWTNGDLKYAEGAIALSVRTLLPTGSTTTSATIQGELVSLGNYSSVETRFAYRPAGSNEWNYSPAAIKSDAGSFAATLTNLTTGQRYEYRAEAESGNETANGETREFTLRIQSGPAPPYILFLGLGGAVGTAAGVTTWLAVRRKHRK